MPSTPTIHCSALRKSPTKAATVSGGAAGRASVGTPALAPAPPRLRVAEVADKGGHRLGGDGDALLDGDAALAAHPHPSSSRRSSSKPKWWAISCTTVIRICSPSSPCPTPPPTA